MTFAGTRVLVSGCLLVSGFKLPTNRCPTVKSNNNLIKTEQTDLR